jgi:hypothetical protein
MRLTAPKLLILGGLFVALAISLPLLGWPNAIFAVFAYFVAAMIVTRL